MLPIAAGCCWVGSVQRGLNITSLAHTRKGVHLSRGSALRCVRSHSHSIWNMANLIPL